MIERTPEPATTRWDDDDPNQDTITLLQEEIARLEAELRDRDECPVPSPQAAPTFPESGALEEALRRVDELLAEVAGRDEAVEILLEQARLYEEAAGAQRAEWEHLNQWVEEVERRVDDRDAEGPRLQAELEAERTRSESIRRATESDRRAWEAQRVGLEREAELLRDQLARQVQGSDAREQTAFVEVAAENRQLRTACESYKESAAESEGLGRRLATTLAELDQARRELRHLDDERRRERAEHEAEVVAVRSELARETLAQRVQATGAAPTSEAAEAPKPSGLEADERIRAFRQHLNKLHEDEATRRANRSISSRLSRLWRHTGPA